MTWLMWSFIPTASSLQYRQSAVTFCWSMDKTCRWLYAYGVYEFMLGVKVESFSLKQHCLYVYLRFLCSLWVTTSGFWEIMLTVVILIVPPVCICANQTLVAQQDLQTSQGWLHPPQLELIRNLIVCGFGVKEQDCLLPRQIVLPLTAQPPLASDGILLNLPCLPSIQKRFISALHWITSLLTAV